MEQRKENWFARQADGLQRAAPHTFPLNSVVCALCCRWFHRDALELLTIEHVPAASLGGRPLVLTCQECNNTSGSQVEAETRRLKDLEEGPERPFPVKVEVGGHEVNARVAKIDGAMSIQWEAAHNRPGAVDALNEHVTSAYPTGSGEVELGLTLRRPIDQYLADVGWLKAGYLVLFAALGHAVAFSPSLTKVREEIQKPAGRRLEGFYAELDDDSAHTIWQVIGNEHPLHGCFVVRFGRHSVILPCPYWPSDPYPYLSERVGKAGGISAYMEPHTSWPLAPILEQDGTFDWAQVVSPAFS